MDPRTRRTNRCARAIGSALPTPMGARPQKGTRVGRGTGPRSSSTTAMSPLTATRPNARSAACVGRKNHGAGAHAAAPRSRRCSTASSSPRSSSALCRRRIADGRQGRVSARHRPAGPRARRLVSAWSGSPHVTGVAALAVSRFGKMGPEMLHAILRLTATPLSCPRAPYDPGETGAPAICTGVLFQNSFYGGGEVNAPRGAAQPTFRTAAPEGLQSPAP
jgi:hypothetical protein